MKEISIFFDALLRGCRAHRTLGAAVGLALAMVPPVFGQGMPAEARANIHTLFNGHDQVRRELKLTDEGAEAITQSADSKIAAALQDHVEQMQDRLESGLAVRRWDPAFAEYRAYYDQIEFKVEKTGNGVKIVARGKSPEAVKVAQNHAKVITEFVNDGWTAHDALHPAALTAESPQIATGATCDGKGKGRCGSGGCPGGCGREGVDKTVTDQPTKPKVQQ